MLWVWKQGIPHSGVLLWPIYLVTRKTEKFEWGPEHEDALQQVLAALHGALLPGPCDLADLTMLKCQWHGSCSCLWQDFIGVSESRPLGFWSKVLPSLQIIHSFEKQLLAYHWALVEIEHSTIGHSVTMHPDLPIGMEITVLRFIYAKEWALTSSCKSLTGKWEIFKCLF